jgi:hypothetical protein
MDNCEVAPVTAQINEVFGDSILILMEMSTTSLNGSYFHSFILGRSSLIESNGTLKLSIKMCTFKNILKKGGSGSIILAELTNGGVLFFESCSFENCGSFGYGGAVYLYIDNNFYGTVTFNGTLTLVDVYATSGQFAFVDTWCWEDTVWNFLFKIPYVNIFL